MNVTNRTVAHQALDRLMDLYAKHDMWPTGEAMLLLRSLERIIEGNPDGYDSVMYRIVQADPLNKRGPGRPREIPPDVIDTAEKLLADGRPMVRVARQLHVPRQALARAIGRRKQS